MTSNLVWTRGSHDHFVHVSYRVLVKHSSANAWAEECVERWKREKSIRFARAFACITNSPCTALPTTRARSFTRSFSPVRVRKRRQWTKCTCTICPPRQLRWKNHPESGGPNPPHSHDMSWARERVLTERANERSSAVSSKRPSGASKLLISRVQAILI